MDILIIVYLAYTRWLIQCLGIDAMWVGMKISSSNLQTTGFTTSPGNATEVGLLNWLWVKCDPISTRVFIAMLRGGMVDQFFDLIHEKYNSSKQTDGNWRLWCQFHQFTWILGWRSTSLWWFDCYLHVTQNTGYFWAQPSDILVWELSLS